MAKFSEMPAKMQFLIVFGVVAGLTVAAYFGMYKSIADTNAVADTQLTAKKAEN